MHQVMVNIFIFLLLIIVGFCQGHGDIYLESLEDIDFIVYGRLGEVRENNFFLRSHFLRGMQIIEQESQKIYRQIIVYAVGENKSETAFTIIDGNCDAPNYSHVQRGVINMLKSKFVGLRIVPTKSDHDRFTCYEIVRAEW
jgi:hypothetical protein